MPSNAEDHRVYTTEVDPARLKIPSHLRLADEEYYKPGVIDLLVGAGTF